MKRLRILHIDFEKTWRGGQQQLFWLAEGLLKKEHKNFIICKPESGLQRKLEKNSFNYFTVRMLFEIDPFAIYKTAKIIEQTMPDIVHLHSPHAHSIGLLAAKFAKHKSKLISSRRVSFHIKSRWKYKNVDRIIAVSEDVKKILVEDGIPEENIRVVHSGIDLSGFSNVDGRYILKELGLSREQHLVGTIGALAPHKDHKNFLQSVVIVKKKLTDVKFLIIGDGKLRSQMEGLVQELNISNDVIFTGFRDDIPSLMSILDVVVVSSSEGEGSPATIKEAMVSGVPAVSTDIGGIRELISDNVDGLLVPPKNPELLADGIIKILKDRGLREQFSRAGKIKAKNFSKEKMVEKTEKVYSEII